MLHFPTIDDCCTPTPSRGDPSPVHNRALCPGGPVRGDRSYNCWYPTLLRLRSVKLIMCSIMGTFPRSFIAFEVGLRQQTFHRTCCCSSANLCSEEENTYLLDDIGVHGTLASHYLETGHPTLLVSGSERQKTKIVISRSSAATRKKVSAEYWETHGKIDHANAISFKVGRQKPLV